ncbi:unnamed protein product [Clonostachys rhizophaga]|uniref:Uncharacterized protein n=1 Tax=Clonostachys rhizophaga TaxID=160324 RepID=A0A9N9YK50_9HYPO|nr:unnamed protein product [Clonostachys rhizophaga]
MFDFPEAKRVRREELNGSDCSEDSDVEYDAVLRARFEARLAETIKIGPAETETQPEPGGSRSNHGEDSDAQIEDGNGELEFCLFGGTGAVPTKVVLEDDSESDGEGGLVPTRPYSFYFPGRPPRKLQKEYDFSAVSGQDVLERSRQRFWGMEYPWKVTHITATRKGGPAAHASKENEDPNKRKRPGKKQRIALRVKAKERAAEAEAASKQAAEKEEQVKDKKKRMNRLKKLRKRAKEKGKKIAARGTGGEDDAGESDGDSAGTEE